MANEWENWDEVTRHVLGGHRLFRSSAPNYHGHDADQLVTDTAIAWLTKKHIDTIVSFNAVPYTDDEQRRVSKAGIFYRHLPVVDFTAPTFQQLQLAAQVFNDRPSASMLVHCGFGWGRTGTGITALQLFATWGDAPPEDEWESVNHVERPEQMEVLRRIRAHYRGE